MKFFILRRHLTIDETPALADVYPVDRVVGEAPQCPVCGRFIGPLAWLPPYRVELEMVGREFPEIIEAGGDDLLVTDRFRDAYVARGLIGLSGFDPVEVVRVKWRSHRPSGEPPAYFHAGIARSGAAIDDAASGIVREGTPCASCRQARLIKRAQRLVLEHDTWTGEDIFIARGLPGTFFATERFKRMCDEENIRGAVLIPTEAYGFDHYPSENS
jgi:hypothetical protein